MNSRDAIKLSIDMADTISLGYLGDLTDKEMMERPHPGCNHINWQVGHLVAGENQMMNQVAPGAMPPLPAGFAEKYTKETAKSDNAADFLPKAELLKVQQQQRAATLAVLAKVSDSDLDKATGVEYAPTVGAMLAMQGSHWMMHCGQWVIVRRKFGRPPLF